ncbi:MAG: ABC transporter ATP-binding protein [Mesorhizobium sp.]|uniref:taurine ABC transporter ATP-binding protein n=2 Tax=Mesorhizobium TaxID=68287 RepID=UPI000BAF3BB0|nr:MULTISPECIES: ABC transporter ATP-binding protein [unclassified Mesorhizobium]AZO61815.1 ABC transporter ATP-binding protein [Mesorhizobium sp. M1A.F.Ca.IN.022.06.1.1]MCT2581208.1 ABC transporter ATP-binding protein [Mesorhizobium sp. P13.3]MDF3170162.1 ABC transporter ATP-binding protein [Mesorhizobium sp. P16.1]MDF3181128.1 ABC transporter ATP-binding protein [Mesorhizobium sp. P17.1]MDF3187120.1 ABC transporter ATP-binding protein [Mesorhizobium sp. ICCV3110.1]
MLRIRDASVTFPGSDGQHVHALDHVSLDIAPASIVVAVGASGCGKSTLLNAIAGFLPLTEGTITLDGREIAAPGGDRGVVFQKDTLLPWANVLDNVALGLKYRSVSRGERHERSRHLLELVGLADFAEKPPYELSGGMRQRVGIARALATDPKILLMDEPFGALDSLTRETMQQLLASVWAKTGKQILFITHSIEEALTLGTTIVVMSPRPGRIIARFDADFVRDFAESGDIGPILSRPRFIELRQEIRSLIHQPEGARRGTLQ